MATVDKIIIYIEPSTTIKFDHYANERIKLELVTIHLGNVSIYGDLSVIERIADEINGFLQARKLGKYFEEEQGSVKQEGACSETVLR